MPTDLEHQLPRFAEVLGAAGAPSKATSPIALEVDLPPGATSQLVFRAARDAGIQVRGLTPRRQPPRDGCDGCRFAAPLAGANPHVQVAIRPVLRAGGCFRSRFVPEFPRHTVTNCDLGCGAALVTGRTATWAARAGCR